MPSTWERWGVDADGDGLANPWSAEDAIAAAARYLAASGGATDISRAVFSYNHAQWYVDEVLQLAQLFGSGGVDATFNLDRLQVSLDQSRKAVVQANRKVLKASSATCARSAAARGLAAPPRGVSAPPLRPACARPARRPARRAGQRRCVCRRRSHCRASSPRHGQDLAQARDRSLSASFAPAAGSLMAAPAYNARYVFPAGAAPRSYRSLAPPPRLSGGRIAAPEGSPVYALPTRSSSLPEYPDGHCGIGLSSAPPTGRVRRTDLSYLVPTVTPASSSPPARRSAWWARRPRLRAAPAPAARPGDLVSACSPGPELRGRRLPLAGRRADGFRSWRWCVFAIVFL